MVTELQILSWFFFGIILVLMPQTLSFIGRLWRRFRHIERLRAVAAQCKDISEPDSKERFQQVCRRFFSFLEGKYGFQRDPPRLHEADFNPYMVIYRSRSLTIVIEGLSYGTSTLMCLIDRDRQLLDIGGLMKRRNPELLNLCSLAYGQDEQIPLYAEALLSCAADILDGDLKAVSRIETVQPRVFLWPREFSFGADAQYMDYFLMLHAPRL
jgi:hypothetical protein